MAKTSSENNNKTEEKIVAKNEPVIDSINSGTTYYGNKGGKGEKYFMISLLAISAIFIWCLPGIYKVVNKFNLGDLFKKDEPVTEEKGEGAATGDKEEEKETFVAVVCTKATSDDVVTAHTLYFSNSKLKKLSLAETYTLGQNYNSKELDKYYKEKKDKYNNYDKINIETTKDENIYSATASIDLYEVPSVASEMMTINVDYDDAQDDVVEAYETNGFKCE